MSRATPRIRDRVVDPRVVKQMADNFTNVGGMTGDVEGAVRAMLAKRLIDPKTHFRVVPGTSFFDGYHPQVGDLITAANVLSNDEGYGTVLEVTRIIKRITYVKKTYGGTPNDEIEVLNLSTGKTTQTRYRTWMKKVELL